MRWSTRTIRGQILLAFLVMSTITAALGAFATMQIRETGALASKTFDQSLMSVSYARAAAADFATMQGLVYRERTGGGDNPDVRQSIEDLRSSLLDDLSIAGDRSQSRRAAVAADNARAAVMDWDRDRAADNGTEGTAAAEKAAAAVNQQIDMLVNYTAGDGFLHRQSARAITNADIRANLMGTGAALLLSAVVVWLLARRLIDPVAAASTAARQIAAGRLDCVIPPGSDDELGALLTAMGLMRDNLRAMMEREVEQRQSAQNRLADALESSSEGIVVVDQDRRIALANAQIARFLVIPPQLLQPGTPVGALATTLGGSLLFDAATSHQAQRAPVTSDARLTDGRWLRISRSATREGGFIAVLSDLTVLKQQEERLRATNLSLDAALENMSQGLCLYDAQGRLIVFNSRFNEIFHLSPGDVKRGLTFEEVFKLKVAAGNYGEMDPAEVLTTRTALTGRLPGQTLFEELASGRTIAITHRSTADGGWVATYEDVTERRQAERQILFMARHDALTRLPNRVLFGERIDQALAQLGRGSGFAVLCLDLDRFKQVNDTLGHPAGDELLRHIADRLEACVREIDTVARLGGDEFAVIQSGIASIEDAVILARRIVEVISAPLKLEDQHVSVGVSIGIALAPGDGSSGTELLKNADAALYRAKADGRGTWRCFEPAMDSQLQARRVLENDLWTGLEEKQFELHYQPLYDLQEDRIGGFEALLRWNHPTRGRVTPADFIPVAEEIGLIGPLGDWVLRQACDEATRWPPHVKVAVNVSPAQFKGRNLVGAVTAALSESGLSPSRLELEITETVLLANSAATLGTLHALRAKGVRFSMDDFGTGYSSLSYLRSFPFDKLKIDQSFIRDLTTASDSGVIVRAITGLGSSLGMRTTAEGVETAAQLARLREEGCNEVQGYYFSRPVPPKDLPALLLRWNSGATLAA